MLVLKTVIRFWAVGHWTPVLAVCDLLYYPDSTQRSLSRSFSADVLGDFLVMLALVGQRHLLILQSLWYEKEVTSPSASASVAPAPASSTAVAPSPSVPHSSSSGSPMLSATLASASSRPAFPRSGESILYRLGKERHEGEDESEKESEEPETEWYWGFKQHFERIVLLRPERSKDYYARILGLELLFFVGLHTYNPPRFLRCACV